MKSNLPRQFDMPNWFSNTPSWFGDSEDGRKNAKQSAERFWQAQSKILDNFESLSNAWLERRKHGTAEALATTTRICECKDPQEIGSIYNEWFSRSLDRWVADGRAISEQSMQALQQVIETVEALAPKSDSKAPAQVEPKSQTGAKSTASATKAPDQRSHAA
jgi:hypothetical protein